mgnify:CR=1 FL=1
MIIAVPFCTPICEETEGNCIEYNTKRKMHSTQYKILINHFLQQDFILLCTGDVVNNKTTVVGQTGEDPCITQTPR